MELYITPHASDRAKQRLGNMSQKRLRDEALTAMIYGKRRDNAFIYKGVAWGFNQKLDTLKTVYPVSGAHTANRA